MAACNWDYKDFTAFAVAAWALGRVKGASKSAASVVRQTLVLVEAATDVVLHVAHPLVSCAWYLVEESLMTPARKRRSSISV